MDILNGFISETDNNSKNVIFVILILVFVLGFGKNTGFNLFNNSDVRGSAPHHKHRRNSCNSQGG
ncbi:hypothetical protein [Candidatus Clostridium radicumherbarum]|uniref:Uncharacterized protein n=1 Tax=Candidatus Clostridium radicumherbarum TaxID=3381662 RepID=A0ABW8TYM2_9CLOT